MNKNALFGLIGIAVFELIAIIALMFQLQSKKALLPQNIIRLTQSVTTLNGTVTKVSGNTITITVNSAMADAAVTTATAQKPKTSLSPTPAPLIFEVETDKQTLFVRPSSIAVKLFDKPVEVSKPSLKDVAVGSTITVQSSSDLRLVDDNRFHASSVILPSIINMVQGTVANVTGESILVHAYGGPVPKKQDYFFKITKDTEISRYESAAVNGLQTIAPKRLSLDDVKKGAVVTVWSLEDISKATTPTAARIEPVAANVQTTVTPPPATPTSIPMSSPTIQPTASKL